VRGSQPRDRRPPAPLAPQRPASLSAGSAAGTSASAPASTSAAAAGALAASSAAAVAAGLVRLATGSAPVPALAPLRSRTLAFLTAHAALAARALEADRWVVGAVGRAVGRAVGSPARHNAVRAVRLRDAEDAVAGKQPPRDVLLHEGRLLVTRSSCRLRLVQALPDLLDVFEVVLYDLEDAESASPGAVPLQAAVAAAAAPLLGLLLQLAAEQAAHGGGVGEQVAAALARLRGLVPAPLLTRHAPAAALLTLGSAGKVRCAARGCLRGAARPTAFGQLLSGNCFRPTARACGPESVPTAPPAAC
jgi:hypothetical protein